MPHVSVTLPDNQQAITRPVIFDIVNQVTKITKLPESEIFYVGELQSAINPGSSVEDQDRHARFNVANRLYIEATETRDPYTLATTSVRGREHIPVFLDRALGIAISPVYATHDVTITFKYTANSETLARRWKDDIEMNLSAMRDVNLHDITYHYLLPVEYLKLLKHLYDLREATVGYGQSFEEYVSSFATDRLTLLSNFTVSETRLAVSEKQCKIVGQYGFDGVPQAPERDSNDGVWIISFEYKFSYEKPVGCDMQYPVSVHNEVIDGIYTDDYDSNIDLLRITKSYSKSMGTMASFETDTTMNHRVSPFPYIRIPFYDDYKIPMMNTGTGTVMVCLCTLDLPDKRTLLNLNELGDYMLDREIIKFIKASEVMFLTMPYYSFVNVSLYKNNRLQPHDSIRCTPELNVIATKDLDPRSQYRIMISLVVDLELIQRAAIDRLMKHPKAFVKIIGALNELLRNHPNFNSYGDRTVITIAEFDPIFEILTGRRLGNGRGVNVPTDYSPTAAGSNWPYRGQGAVGAGINDRNVLGRSGYSGGLFDHLDPRLVEHYRQHRPMLSLVQNTGIVALRNE